MTKPEEFRQELPMKLANDKLSTTTDVWNILEASYRGDIDTVKKLSEACPELLFAQYNYTPPIHFAVREGHVDLVRYILNEGAHDITYRIYPFLENLEVLAEDRGYEEISKLLSDYRSNTTLHKYRGDNGEIIYPFTEEQKEFQRAVEKHELEKVKSFLKNNPGLLNETRYCWGEGILLFPSKESNFEMIELLLAHGAIFPTISKWPQFYYFERFDGAEFILSKGMNPDHKSWQEVTILHDMAQKGFVDKAKLLINHGAYIDPVDDDYQSTPLGMAARWGQLEMVDYLLKQGADPNKSGADWSRPLVWARRKNHFAIERLLLDAGAE